MYLPFLNLFVLCDALLRGWCVAYVGDVSALKQFIPFQSQAIISCFYSS
jgi:hypothetical protein